MGQRITRKQLKEDEFASTIDRALRWLIDHWRPLAGALGAIIAVVLLWWAGSVWSGSRAASASMHLAEAVETYMGEGATTTGVPSGDLEAAEAAFRSVVDRYGRSDQGDVARLYLARIMMGRGETDAARDMLLKLSESHRNDALGRVATLDLIALRIESGQAAEVEGELQAMVRGENPRLPRDAALYELGVLYVKEQRFDEARQYLQQLVDDFPESPYVFTARQRLTELG